jgi:hypothetical protein
LGAAVNKRKERRDGRYDRIIVPDFDLVGSLYRKSTVGSGTSPPISDRKWGDFSDEDRRLVEGRILDGPPQWEGEEPDEYVRRKAVTSATILGWLEFQGCKLSAEARRSLPEMRKADERWRREWDATVDESHESRGGSVAVNTDTSKIIDAPLAQVVPLAIEHTRHPFAEYTEYRPFDGLVKERPLRALSALSFEARNGEYPTRFWQSALTDWPNEVSSRLRCSFAARIVRLPQNVVFDLRYYIPRWFQTNFPKMAKESRKRYWPLWDHHRPFLRVWTRGQ